MDLYQYQDEAVKLAWYKAVHDTTSSAFFDRIAYLGLGLAGEAGESADCIKKILRTRDPQDQDRQTDKLLYEMGDVMWYWINLCGVFGFDPEEVLRMNIAKLKIRQKKEESEG